MNTESESPPAPTGDLNTMSDDEFAVMFEGKEAPLGNEQSATPAQETPVAAETPTEAAGTEAPVQDTETPAEEPAAEEGSNVETEANEQGGSPEDTGIPPETNYDQVAQDISGGRYKTMEDLRSANLSEQLAEKDGMQSELDTLRDQSEQSPFANEFSAKVDQLVRDGNADELNKFMFLQNINTQGADIDVLANEMVLNTPNMTHERANAYLNRKYNQGEEFDDADSDFGKTDMAIDANAARGRLEGLKVDRSLPDLEAQNAETERLDQERMENWDNSLDEIVKEAQKEAFSIDISTDEDPNLSFDWEIKASELGSVTNNVFDTIGQSGLDINDGNSRSQAKEAVVAAYLTQDNYAGLKQMVRSAVTNERSRIETKHHKKSHNPSAANLAETQKPAPTGNKSPGTEEQMMDAWGLGG